MPHGTPPTATAAAVTMQMAKPSQNDIEAAGTAMALLNDLAGGYYPAALGERDATVYFDPDDDCHLRRLYDALQETLVAAPGWPSRVIGGMCFVVMFPKNELIDPGADMLQMHPKLEAALAAAAEPYSADADPRGIRAYVADAITGALMLGAQGTDPAPEGHWLDPFWKMAREERAGGVEGLPGAVKDVLIERRRQAQAEGYTAEHDDAHVNDEIAAMAALFLMPEGARDWDASSTDYGATMAEALLPADWNMPRFGDRRRQLVKGAAMALAEIERLDRAAQRAHEAEAGAAHG